MQLSTDMKALLTSVILAACLSAVLAASLPSHEADDRGNMVNLEAGPHPDELTRLTWLRYLIQSKQQQQAAAEPAHLTAPEKRFSSFGMPYIKYRVDKRNNGVWIWMPAQGYVSVPKQKQELTEDASEKQGKIMRYGK